MGLFSINYINVPGQCVYGQGGLKFRSDEERLRKYFAEILPYITLNDLIGEASFWILLPNTLLVWTFAFLIYTRSILFALSITALLSLIIYTLTLFLYIKPINYLVYFFASPFLQIPAYIALIIILITSGSILKAIILLVSYLLFKFELPIILTDLILMRKIIHSARSDQILKNIGYYYAKKYLK